jgi:hypothetical protein
MNPLLSRALAHHRSKRHNLDRYKPVDENELETLFAWLGDEITTTEAAVLLGISQNAGTHRLMSIMRRAWRQGKLVIQQA